MTIHHISCGTMCPLIVGRMVCHCLVVETGDGLVLVETGLGTADIAEPRRLRRAWRMTARPRLDPADTAIRRIEALGFTASDVRHIVVTHLDLDHAGGIPDFPHATIHLHQRELDAATARATARARRRYVPAHFAHGPRWRTYSESGERWFGFDSVRAVAEADREILLIPLPGHTEGHSGVAVRDGDRWLLHCGDAYFHHGTLTGTRVPRLLSWFERRMQTEPIARRHNAERLAELYRAHRDDVVVFNSHDAAQFDAVVGASLPGGRHHGAEHAELA